MTEIRRKRIYLVVRDHVVFKQRHVPVLLGVGSHAGHHEAIHCIDTASEVGLFVAHELAWALRMGELERRQAERSAGRVEGARFGMSVVDGGKVIWVDGRAIVEKLNATRHVLVNVAEIEEICVVILVVLQFNAVGSIARPFARRVEEFRLVVIQSNLVPVHSVSKK